MSPAAEKNAYLATTFPRPKSSETKPDVALDPSCNAPIARLERGLAFEQDVWAAVICETARMKPEAVDGYLAKVRSYLESVPKHHRDFPKAKLSAALLAEAQYSTDDFEALPKETRVLASRAAVEKFPELQERQYLGSGGIRGICNPFSQDGHYQVTRQALLDVSGQANTPVAFSPDAVATMSDASQDPDLFAWDDLAAHGQTKANDDGMPAETAQVAQEAWMTFVANSVDAAQKSCAKNDVRWALYHLGYGLHAIQDVASHRGRTNPEHAYNAKKETSPDDLDASVALARDMSTRFLTSVLRRAEFAACKGKFKNYSGAPIAYAEKVSRPNVVLQLTPSALLKYRASADLFAPHASDPASRVRWFGTVADGPTACTRPDCQGLLSKLLGTP